MSKQCFIARKVASKCSCQVILSAGALGSPHLLLKNGIGAQKSLQDAGVQCIHDLPGVGENLQDHLQLRPGTFCMKVMQETPGHGFRLSCALVIKHPAHITSVVSGCWKLIPIFCFSKKHFWNESWNTCFVMNSSEIFWNVVEAKVSCARCNIELPSGWPGILCRTWRCRMAGCCLKPNGMALRGGILVATDGSRVHGSLAGLRLRPLQPNEKLGEKFGEHFGDFFGAASFEWRTDWEFFSWQIWEKCICCDWVSVIDFFGWIIALIVNKLLTWRIDHSNGSFFCWGKQAPDLQFHFQPMSTTGTPAVYLDNFDAFTASVCILRQWKKLTDCEWKLQSVIQRLNQKQMNF